MPQNTHRLQGIPPRPLPHSPPAARRSSPWRGLRHKVIACCSSACCGRRCRPQTLWSCTFHWYSQPPRPPSDSFHVRSGEAAAVVASIVPAAWVTGGCRPGTHCKCDVVFRLGEPLVRGFRLGIGGLCHGHTAPCWTATFLPPSKCGLGRTFSSMACSRCRSASPGRWSRWSWTDIGQNAPSLNIVTAPEAAARSVTLDIGNVSSYPTAWAASSLGPWSSCRP